MNDTSYLLALTTGLLGGAHCVGMCGPIVASYALQGELRALTGITILKKIFPHLLYNLGRISTYAFIGALMGMTGSFVNNIAGFQSIVRIAAGAVMILMGINITGLTGGFGWLEKRGGLIMKTGAELLSLQSLWRYFILGALFGFLPCGLSYSMFAASAGTGNPVSGFLVSLLFGLGTLPWLVVFGVSASLVSAHLRGYIYKASGVIVIIMGLFYLVRGIKMYA